MEKEKFLAGFADAIQYDGELELDIDLASLEEWDSLAIISTMAFLEHSFGKKLSGNALKSAKTIRDIALLADLKD